MRLVVKTNNSNTGELKQGNITYSERISSKIKDSTARLNAYDSYGSSSGLPEGTRELVKKIYWGELAPTPVSVFVLEKIFSFRLSPKW